MFSETNLTYSPCVQKRGGFSRYTSQFDRLGREQLCLGPEMKFYANRIQQICLYKGEGIVGESGRGMVTTWSFRHQGYMNSEAGYK